MYYRIEMLEFITNESGTRYLHKLDQHILDTNLGEMNAISNIDSTDIEQLNILEKESIPPSTASQTKRHVDTLKDS